jgi:hypothetical protein
MCVQTRQAYPVREAVGYGPMPYRFKLQSMGGSLPLNSFHSLGHTL